MNADASRVGSLVLLATFAVLVAFQLPSDVFFDFGPNDGRYTHGFRGDFEVDEPTIIHWSGDRSSITLPFYVRGPHDVTLRFKRHIAAPADVRFFVNDEAVGSVRVPQQDFRLFTLNLDGAATGTFQLDLVSQSDDPRPLSLALDWMQIVPARRFGSVLPSVTAMLWMLSWVIAFYAVPRLVGLGRNVATWSSALSVTVLVALTVIHKFWPVHASATLGARAHVIMAVFVLFFAWRQRIEGSVFREPVARWVMYIIFVGLAVRLFALFHPDFYYPDVRTHSKFVSLIWTEGLSDFFSDYIANQHTHLLGLQLVGGQWIAFPYPPLLYLTIYPLSLLQLPVEEWMMLVPTALTGVEALVLFAIAGRLGVSANAAFIAVALHATARVLGFRLAVASYAAMFGHFWDMLVVLYLVVFFDRIDKPRYALGFAGLIAVSLLSYAGSALVLGIFVPAFCLAFIFVAKERRPETRVLVAVAAWALAGALAAVFIFYWQYVPEILTRPGASASSSELIEIAFTPIQALSMAAHRLNLFYGPFALLALFALVTPTVRHFDRGDPKALARPLAGAAIATYFGMNFLRAGLGATHIFQFSKDDLVMLPVIVVAIGILLDGWSRRSLLFPIVTLVAVAAWIGWGAAWFSYDIRSRFIRPGYPPDATPTAPAVGGRSD